MRRSFLRILVLAAGAVPASLAQRPEPPDRLPDGRSRQLAILKDSHKKTLEDISEIRTLAEALEREIEEQTEHVMSIDSLRKAERIEELAQKIQKRMKRIP
jgi:hypothetical protein